MEVRSGGRERVSKVFRNDDDRIDTPASGRMICRFHLANKDGRSAKTQWMVAAGIENMEEWFCFKRIIERGEDHCKGVWDARLGVDDDDTPTPRLSADMPGDSERKADSPIKLLRCSQCTLSVVSNIITATYMKNMPVAQSFLLPVSVEFASESVIFESVTGGFVCSKSSLPFPTLF